jgi:hypothetical protein
MYVVELGPRKQRARERADEARTSKSAALADAPC